MSEIDLPSFPFPHDHLTPSPAYAERRASCPLGRVRLPSGHAAVLLVTHPDIAAALADTRLSHTVTGPDAPRAIDRRRPAIEQAAADLLDTVEAAGAPSDLITDYCFPLPVLIICRLLGVPEQDAPRFRDWSNAFLSAADMPVEERMTQIGEFAAYIADLLARHRAEPGTDLVDDLIAARDGDDRLSEDELAYLTTSLIAGGNETTANSLGRAVLALLSDGREAWEQLVADPSLIPAAVNEVLRHNVLGPGASLRIATEDLELPSGPIAAGEVVAIVGVSGQHDERVHPEPHRLRFDRTTPAELAFGGGPHYCLGAHLAKAELQIGLRLLIERFPKLRLTADRTDLRFTDGEILSSLVELPVTW